MRFSTAVTAAAVALIPFATAQTSTSCNPLDKTCPKDKGLNKATFTSDFTKGKSAFAQWSAAQGTALTFGSNGAEFTIAQAGQAPTVQTDFYIFFGKVEVEMKAAPGAGIVSSIVFLSDDLDEIDWEFLGGNTTSVETNFFGKGNTTVYDRAIYYDVNDPQDEFHTYTVDWNSDRILWQIDGKTVRILRKNNPLTIGGSQYPQTPMRVKLGNWCGGCSGNSAGTIAWAGGPTSFNDAPYNMYVKSVSITNYNPAEAYEYSGHSGSWQSIKVIKGKSSSSKPTKRGLSSDAGSLSVSSSAAAASSSGLSPFFSSVAPNPTPLKGTNGTMVQPTGTGGVLHTQTSIVTAHNAPTPSSKPSSSPNSTLNNSSGAASLSAIGSTVLFGTLFAFLLL